MRRVAREGMLVAVLVATAPSAASAADDATTAREAQARFDEGIARVKAGNLEGARMSFTQAYALLPKPTILWNLALTDEKTLHVVDALEHFREFERGASNVDDRANAQRHISALMAQTVHLEVAAPPGAQVLVDGLPAGTAPLERAVDAAPGAHHIEARTPQGPRTSDVEGAPGQLVHVSLMPPAMAAIPAASPPALAPEPRERERDEEAPSPYSPPAETPEAASTGGSSTGRVTAVALLGTAAATSVGLAIYFAFKSQANERDAQGYRNNNQDTSTCSTVTVMNASTCATWNDIVQSQSRNATLSDVLYVAGGVLAAGALATWIFWPSETKTAAWVLAPSVGPAGAGVLASGHF